MKQKKVYIAPESVGLIYRELCDNNGTGVTDSPDDWPNQMSNSYDSSQSGSDFEWNSSPWEEETSWQ